MAAWGQMKVDDAAVLPRLVLNCWGDFALTDHTAGGDLKLRGRKTRALLAYLAFHPGKPISRERLTGLLWGDRGEEQARASLRQAILELKPLAGEHGVIEIERDHLTLHAGLLTTDLEQMRRAIEASDYARLLDLLPEREERLFANLDGLDEAFDDWLTVERSRQSDALITLTADASAAALSQGQMRAARALHARLREFDPAVGSLPPSQEAARPPVQANAISAAPGQPDGKSPYQLKYIAIAGLLAILSIIAASVWLLQPRSVVTPPTVAVLPFAGVAGDNRAFADGLSEEITSQLVRQHGLRVAGRTSTAQLSAQTADLRRLGRKLHVSYILEGSVRSVGDRVRVNVALTKTADGLQLWADTFDGTLDDILAIQYRIAANVAKALNRQLAGETRPTGSLATNGQVYSLYLTSRGLIRERNGDAGRKARANLEKAVSLDPSFAPGWSSLAQAEYPGGEAPDAAIMTQRAIAHARRALTLAPDLPEAHAVLGMVYGFASPLGQQHIQRAAQLDPNNAEYQYWLGNVYAEQANFAAMLDAYRKAFALDPLWGRPQEYLVQMAWTMGNRDEARAVVRRVESDGTAAQGHLIRAALAKAQGDLSEEARQYELAAAVAVDPGRKSDAEWRRSMVLEELGLFEQSYAIRRRWCGERLPAALSDPYVAIRRGKLPSFAELQARQRNAEYSWRDFGYVGRAYKQLINGGRARDVVALYDAGDLLQIPPNGSDFGSRFLEDGPVVAAALRAVGRKDEANRLLDRLASEIALAQKRSRGRVPARFVAVAAQTWAMRGEDDRALAALRQALAMGWLYVVDMDDSSLSDFGDEPAFRALRGRVEFEAIRSRINQGLARERREAAAAAHLT